MARGYMTSDDLIASVKRRAFIPGSQSTFSDTDLLQFANEEMSMGLVPSVMRMHEDYLLFSESITLEPGQSKYTIPYRAVGNKVREVAYIDTNNNTIEMSRISLTQLPDYNIRNSSTNRIHLYYIQNNEIVLVPELSTAVVGTLKVTYYLRPNELVKLENVAVVTNIDTNTGDITVSKIPSGYSSNNLMDFISVKSPHVTLSFDKQPTSVNSTTNVITFNPTDIPTRLTVGDHVCLAGESAIPQVPSDLHVVLAHRVAARCLEAMGDNEALGAANQKLAEMELNTPTLIDNRVEGSPKKIIARHGFLRRGIFNKKYGR